MASLPHTINIRITKDMKTFLDKRLCTAGDYIRDLIKKEMKR